MEGWIAVFAALIAAGAAIGLAVIDARQVKIGQDQVRVSQQQVKVSQEQLDNQQLPILVPSGKLSFQANNDA